ncbi:MAG: calcium:proton antiporter [Actinomycetia bacterium]|nr:calcium:proton antiporter [Actinomycetes bacterium]MCH9801368.1 calcium:proton antiporter [Actinomycetes bacterium]
MAPPSLLRTEWTWLIVAATAVLFSLFGSQWTSNLSSFGEVAVIFGWLFVVILLAAFNVVRHAEALAVKLGEPLGTLILTLSVISIEVLMISSVMLTGDNQPTLARDTMFAVTMIVLCGLVGLALLVGGLKHHEQSYNLQGANAYLAVIMPLALLGLVLPDFTTSTDDQTLSTTQEIMFMVIFLALYGVFLAIQTVRHREIFIAPTTSPQPATAQATTTSSGAAAVIAAGSETDDAEDDNEDDEDDLADDAHDEHPGLVVRSVSTHALLLLAFLIPVVLLSKELAYPIDYVIEESGAPVALGGFIVALLILSPEAMTGLRAALANKLQRSVNLYLGSIAATIGLTIPAVLAVGIVTGKAIVLGLEPKSIVLLAATLAVSMLTFASRRTNVLHGVVHLALFAAYLMLLFD